MKERIDIIVPDKKLAENDVKKERLAKTRRIEKTDRVPVSANPNPFTLLAGRGVTFAEHIKGPKENLRSSILNFKWKAENIDDDEPIPTEILTISPDMGTVRGTEFPMEIVWDENQPPKTIHLLKEAENIDSLVIPDPWSGLNAKYIEWYHAMKAFAEDFDVRINGQQLKININLSYFGGPIPTAFAIAGENLLLWTYTDPDRLHKLMDIVTKSFIQVVEYYDELLGRSTEHSQLMGADIAEMLSPELFNEFVVPYYNRIWDRFKGERGLHMCGKIDHLLDILRDEMKINALNGFGFPTNKNLLKEKWAGKVYMSGGPHPYIFKNNTDEEIINECISYINTAGSMGGYRLTPGGEGVPGTSVNKYKLLQVASKRAAGICE